MDILIVESQGELGILWQRHLERHGMTVVRTDTRKTAIGWLQNYAVDIIILDLFLSDGAALAVSDFANYKHPKAKVIFVTNTLFFSDGSIFAHCANACAFMPSAVPPEDLAALVEHCHMAEV